MKKHASRALLSPKPAAAENMEELSPDAMTPRGAIASKSHRQSKRRKNARASPAHEALPVRFSLGLTDS